MSKINKYFYEAFTYYKYFNSQGFNRREETEYLININWIDRWKEFNYSNLKKKYFSKYNITNQNEYNIIFAKASKEIQLTNDPGIINNMDIIEDLSSFLNDGDITDPFNLVVDISKKKYMKIPQSLFKLFKDNYNIDYVLSSYYSEQRKYNIYFFDEKENLLDEGKIYLNKNKISNLSKRLINIIKLDILNIKTKNIKEDDLIITFNKSNLECDVIIKGGKKGKNINKEKSINTMNSQDLSKSIDISENSNEISKKNSKKMDKSISTVNVIKKNEIIQNKNEINDQNYLIKVNKKEINVYKNGIIGLMNLGNTCYMNSVIQVLSNIKELRKYFFSEQLINDMNDKSDYKGEIAEQFYYLLTKIWNCSNKSEKMINPKEFKDTFGKYNQQYNNLQSHDTIEFLIILLNCLQEDLLKGKKLSKPFNEYENTKEVRWELYKLMNKSIIFDLFYGMQNIEINCLNLNCLYKTFNFEIFNVLHLPLHGPQFTFNKNELRNYKFYYINCYIVLYPFDLQCVCIKFPIEYSLFTNIINDEIIQFIKKITYIENFEVKFDELNNNKNEINELVKSDFLWKKKNVKDEINIYFYTYESNNLRTKDLINTLENNKINIRNYFLLEYLKKKKNIKQTKRETKEKKEKKKKELSFFYITNFIIKKNNDIQRIGTQQIIKFNQKDKIINLYQEICRIFNIKYDYKKEKSSLYTFNIINDDSLNNNLKNYNVIHDIKNNYDKLNIPFIISIRINSFNNINIPIPYNLNITLEEFKDYLLNNLELYSKEISKLNFDIFYLEKNNENIIKLNNLQNCFIFNFLEENKEKIKSKSIPLTYKIKNNMTLKHLFNFYQIGELYLDNNMTCEYCSQEVYSKISFVKIPKILILHLQRTENLKINKNFIDFDFSINSKNYFHGISEDLQNIQYDLIGIIYFYGNTPNEGHYNCVCKNSNDNKWYKFNDNEVFIMNENELKNENAYALIYQQKKN